MSHTHTPVVLITGATSGIGFETALRLTHLGTAVIIHGPHELEVRRALTRLQHRGADVRRLDGAVADFTRLGEVAALAEHVHARYPRLDVLVNNAAIAAPAARYRTEDGNELTLQVNYLAHYLLTRLLRERLRAANGRVVSVSSAAHRTADIDWTDPQQLRAYRPQAAYAQSKLALTMFSRALAQREPQLTAISVDPGSTDTALLPLYGGAGQPAATGADPVLHLCSPRIRVRTGAYYAGLQIGVPNPLVHHDKALDRLWRLSTAMVGLDRALAASAA
ncbi:SDR family NAD(P)-dependent oxidoreductase [Catellatospora sp. NPDC049111]|uniref:SDR family NAD(P)-dependent oxidoreductase n=1 Tax=Catellatospora sp. NPDC049111 TaxID=3155271 RepID=UPI0033C1413E